HYLDFPGRHVGSPCTSCRTRRRSALLRFLTRISEVQVMSRVANAPVAIPDGVECKIGNGLVTVKGNNQELQFELPPGVEIDIEDGEAKARTVGRVKNLALAGTVRSVVHNMVHGVTKGFERR